MNSYKHGRVSTIYERGKVRPHTTVCIRSDTANLTVTIYNNTTTAKTIRQPLPPSTSCGMHMRQRMWHALSVIPHGPQHGGGDSPTRNMSVDNGDDEHGHQQAARSSPVPTRGADKHSFTTTIYDSRPGWNAWEREEQAIPAKTLVSSRRQDGGDRVGKRDGRQHGTSSVSGIYPVATPQGGTPWLRQLGLKMAQTRHACCIYMGKRAKRHEHARVSTSYNNPGEVRSHKTVCERSNYGMSE